MWLIRLVTVLASLTAFRAYQCPSSGHETYLQANPTDLPHLKNRTIEVSKTYPDNGIWLTLAHNNLTTLPSDLFSDEIFRLVTSLDLSFNHLKQIPSKLLVNFICLEWLDISNNCLESIEKDALHNLVKVKYVYMKYNNISKIGHTTFHENLTKLKVVDLSYNQLSAFEPWPYIPVVKFMHFILHHNQISKFTNSMGWTKSRSYFEHLMVDLSFNKLRYFREEMFLQYMKVNEITLYNIGDFSMNVTHNPWFCDCGVYYGIRIAAESFYKNFASNYFTCHGPSALKGLKLEYFFDHPDLLICNITDKCPFGCKCVDRPHRGHIEVDCSTSGQFTSLPIEVPAGSLFLQMSGNKLRGLAGRDYIGNVSVLNVSNNFIEEIDNSFIELATNLTSVDVSKNKLKTLPSKIQNIPFGSVIFSENPLACSCDTLWLNDWVRRNSDNLSSESTARLICSVDRREHRLVDVTWISLACYRDVAIGVSIALAFLLVLIIVTTVILLRYKYEFKVWMYHYLQVHPFDHAPCDQANDATKLYDVYLSIDRENDDIRIWVKNCLLKQLETRFRSAYKVYYPCRQDVFGDDIADQMVENINRSRRVLAVVNDSYLQSGWSIEEFDHAHRLMEEERLGRLLVIVYGDLDLSRVTQEPLRTYLTEKQCLNINDKRMWQKLQYELPFKPCSNVALAARDNDNFQSF